MLAKRDDPGQELYGPLAVSKITGQMLAWPTSNKSWSEVAAELLAEQEKRVYGPLEHWYALSIEINHEEQSARWLKRNVNIGAYWPNFTEQVRRRGKLHQSKRRAVVPGLLFVPQEFMELKRWEEVQEYARAHGFRQSRETGTAADLGKSEIEAIRQVEAKLNLPPECKGVLFKLGQQVQFVNEMYQAFWGTAVIFEIASEARIGVEVQKAIGGRTKVFVPASMIEAM
jgi:hypothetical protein